MEYHERVINKEPNHFLHVLILDEEDQAEVLHHVHCENVEIELGLLESLRLFPVIRRLILTGGIPTPEGFEALYSHTEIELLVLDYEETDSDEEGIDLSRFPALKYVLSRSNLNILHYSADTVPDAEICVLNHYRSGKPIKTPCYPGHNLYPKSSYLFFSTEGTDGAGSLLIELLLPIEKAFTDRYLGEHFSEKLDNIAIIPILQSPLSSPEILEERRYISWKNRYADIRLHIPYHAFLEGSQKERLAMCRKNIADAVDYVRSKDKTFHADRFLAAVWSLFDEIYSS